MALVDVAYWVKGCSSLGRLRYAALLKVDEGKRAHYCLADLKEGTAAAAPRALGQTMPRDDAVRVVMGAKALSPNLGNRMMASRILGKPIIIRELMPQDLKIEVEELEEHEAIMLSRYLGYAVGRAHGRQLQQGGRAAWAKELGRRTGTDSAVPTWLWASVVDLMGIHEAAVGSSRVDLQACKLEYSIVSPK